MVLAIFSHCMHVKHFACYTLTILYITHRSRCRDNGRLYAAPKFYRHTASVSRGKINPIDPLAGISRWDLNPIDPLAGTSRWDLNPIDPLPGTTRGCVQHE